MDASGNAGVPQPVPQALYVNNSALAAVTPNLQLNSSFIPSSIASTLNAGAASQRSSPAVVSSNRSIVHNSAPALSSLPGASPQPGPPPALVPVSQTHTRPPPAYSNPPRPQQPANNMNRRTVTEDNSRKNLEVECHQIRVGIRKYMPACSVIFKEDGVLFTLREFTNAPLLLNARAISRCKANLSSIHPVLFFALEASCIKQIRTIFHMEEEEFSEKATMERKRCITVFPKSLSQADINAINHHFNTMKAKFGRPDTILFPIDMDAAIDILYGVNDRPSPAQSNSNSASNALTNAANAGRSITNGVANNRHHPYNRANPPMQQQQQAMAQQHRAPAPVQNSVRMSSMMASNAASNQLMMMQYSNMPQATANRMPAIPNASVNRYPAQNPLVIPQDQNAWQQLKRTLVTGTIYPVIQQNDPNKRVGHYLWNGNSFVPYQVPPPQPGQGDQGSEILLHCHNARVGSLKRPSGEQVVIKATNGKLGIQFKIKLPDGVAQFVLYEDEISQAFICFERISAMFIVPHPTAVNRIRSICKMKSVKDPHYDPQSKEERQKHLILFLRQISPSQKDDLLRLKRLTMRTKSMFSEVDAMGAHRTLTSIKQNTPGLQTNTSNGVANVSDLESLAKELTSLDPPPPADDDDDDVIISAEEVTTRCPYTQQEMKEPVRNKNCGHSYEREAIMEFIARRRAKGNDKSAKCPYAGCGNVIPLVMEDLEENKDLKEYILRKQAS